MTQSKDDMKSTLQNKNFALSVHPSRGTFNGLDESELLATQVDLKLLKQTPPGVPAHK